MMFPGIDLGTTFSLIAHVNAHGQPALFSDAHDTRQFSTPSVFYIGREGTLVGQPAEELLIDAPDLPVARFVKAHLHDPAWRYDDHQGRRWSGTGLLALLVRKLLRDAQTQNAEDPGPAVLTVPAQFCDAERKATIAAAHLGGLPHVRLIEEPVAAATYHGLEESSGDRTLLVYDFGGGTFDVTLLQASPEGLFVLATDGVNGLGGRDVDSAMVEQALAALAAQRGGAVAHEPGTLQRLRRVAESAKIKLSQSAALPLVRQPLLLSGQAFEFALTRAQFDDICRVPVARSIQACEAVLAAAGLGWRDVDRIVTTGGSSLLPAVPRALLQASGKPESALITRQPHHAVAYGAALIAARLGEKTDVDAFVRQVSSFDLCLRVWDAKANRPGLEVLIPRNASLPARYSRVFYTNRPDQIRLILEFVQRRGDDPAGVSLGHFAFGPIAAPRRNYPVEVAVDVASDGLIRIAARDPQLGTELSHTLQADGQGPVASPEEAQWVAAARINA
jgi:molecular chaperone DnaK